MSNCKQCGYTFTPLTQRFYCCNKEQPVCSICCRYPCRICKNIRTLQIPQLRCAECFSRNSEDVLIWDEICSKYFCAKCLSKEFKKIYLPSQQSQVQMRQQSVKMPCQMHCYPYKQAFDIYRKICIECGKKYSEVIDYELKDGIKLCYFCQKMTQRYYQDCFIQCAGCMMVLTNYKKANTLDGIVFCQYCLMQTQDQEKSFEQSKKSSESAKKKQQSPKKPTSVNPFELIEKEQQINIVKSFDNLEPQQSKQNVESLQKKYSFSQKKSRAQYFKQTQVLQKNIPEKESSQNNRRNKQFNESENNKQETSTFQQTNDKEKINEQSLIKEQQSVNEYISKEQLLESTFIDPQLLDINLNNDRSQIHCRKCHFLIEMGLAFDLNKQNVKYSQSKSTLASLQSSLIKNSKEEQFLVCAICCMKDIQRQNYLSESRGRNFSQRNSYSRQVNKSYSKMLDESAHSHKEYINAKIGTPDKTQQKSQSTRPIKQYSLTGAKVSQTQLKDAMENIRSLFPSIQQNSFFTPTKSQYSEESSKPKLSKPRIYDYDPVSIRAEKLTPSKRKCQMCGQLKNTLHQTINGRVLCSECYMMKSPHQNGIYR